MVRQVVVFDAADLDDESAFWAQVLGGHVFEDARAAHDEVIGLGARLLQPAADLGAAQGHEVYADPAGHPFCIGWGHPSPQALAQFLARRRGAAGP
jgi:Glyoxalase-like domain